MCVVASTGLRQCERAPDQLAAPTHHQRGLGPRALAEQWVAVTILMVPEQDRSVV
jgi:hypothetical protein